MFCLSKVNIYIKLGVFFHMYNTSLLLINLPISTLIQHKGSDLCDVMEGTDTTLVRALSCLVHFCIGFKQTSGKQSVSSRL